jgi:hypothetical protein
LFANTNDEELDDPIFSELSLMIKKSIFSKACFVGYLTELSLQKESFWKRIDAWIVQPVSDQMSRSNHNSDAT